MAYTVSQPVTSPSQCVCLTILNTLYSKLSSVTDLKAHSVTNMNYSGTKIKNTTLVFMLKTNTATASLSLPVVLIVSFVRAHVDGEDGFVLRVLPARLSLQAVHFGLPPPLPPALRRSALGAQRLDGRRGRDRGRGQVRGHHFLYSDWCQYNLYMYSTCLHHTQYGSASKLLAPIITRVVEHML